MKKTSTRIVAFLLLFAMLLGSFGTITAFAEGDKGNIELSFEPNTEKVKVYLDNNLQDSNIIEDVDVSIAHTLKLVIPEESDHVFKTNGLKEFTDVINPKTETSDGDWNEGANQGSFVVRNNYPLEKEVKATEGTVNIGLKVDGKVLTKTGDIPTGLGLKLDTSEVQEFVFKLENVKIKENHTIKFQLDADSKYEIDGSSEFKIDKLTQLSKPGDWEQKSEGKDNWETDIELKLKSKPGQKVRVYRQYHGGATHKTYLDEDEIYGTGLLVEKGNSYEVTATLPKDHKLIMNPLENYPLQNNPLLELKDNKIMFNAPVDKDQVTIKLAEEVKFDDYFKVRDALVGKTHIALELNKSHEDLKIKNIYAIYNGRLYNNTTNYLPGNIALVFMTDEIKNVGDTIGIIAEFKDGTFSNITNIRADFKAIELKVDPVKAGDKKVTGKTAPEAEVIITREGFEKPLKANAGKDGKFEINVVTTLKGEEVFEIYAIRGTDEKSEIMDITVPKEDVVNKTSRVYGKDRYLTAVEVSKAYFPANSDIKPKTVIIAAGGNEADALAAGPLSIKHGAPILLVEKERIPAEVLAEINRLNPKNIIIVGGKNSVSEAVEKALAATNREITRLAGENRFGTSIEVAKSLKEGFIIKGIILANGYNSVDALAVSGYAAKNNLAVVLTAKEALPQEVKDYIASAKVDHVEIVGGINSVEKAIETDLGEVFKDRTSGADRYQTALELAKKAYKDAKKAIFVNAFTPVDALSAAPFAAKNGFPILLVEKTKIQADTLNYIKETKVEEVTVIGGLNSVADAVMKEFEALTPKIETPEITE